MRGITTNTKISRNRYMFKKNNHFKKTKYDSTPVPWWPENIEDKRISFVVWFQPISLKSYLSLVLNYWYVAEEETNSIMGHMRVIPCTSQWKCRLREYENVIKLLCMLQAFRLAKTRNITIYIHLHSWHKVTHNVNCNGVSSDLQNSNISAKVSMWVI